jgi:2-succinyl-5-enolpyruvyl-6-hydroxy-3-cyclohexene-1-carboxylate synthase
LRDGFAEPHGVVEALDALPDGGTLVVGNSLPIRDLDRFGAPRAKGLRVLANRGASGIDGVTSTALGVAAAREGPTLLVTGDVAFLHDLPGLLAFARLHVQATILVLNNDGGRIFDHLPAAAFQPPYEELFLARSGVPLEPAARMMGASHALVEDAKHLREELARALAGGQHVIEARIDPAASRAWRAAARDAARVAVDGHVRGA